MSRVAVLLAALAALAGCGGGSDVEARLTIVVPDNNIREEGAECAGARPFRAIHRGTAFTVEDGSGAVVAEGELPAGVATNADPTIDWEDELIPRSAPSTSRSACRSAPATGSFCRRRCRSSSTARCSIATSRYSSCSPARG